MPITLRRSCAACAKAKHSCDLRTPQCSRCLKRKSSCVYANEPLTLSQDGFVANADPAAKGSLDLRLTGPALLTLQGENSKPSFPSVCTLPVNIGAMVPDPFDSYPLTSLPRMRVQYLIHHFLSKIAFQYYPLDLNPDSNPFTTSWWPLALADPALFHVSLQTASLDAEMLAQKGFHQSEVLMADAVSLIRRKIQDPLLAFQDATMDSVVTLAAIEHGKGNFEICKLHIDGVKRMVRIRGGIKQIKMSSPLTARMVPWVCMVTMGLPQFQTQDDFGSGNGIAPSLQWEYSLTPKDQNPDHFSLDNLDIHPACADIMIRLRNIFHQPQIADSSPQWSKLQTTDLLDLTCFVLHRLLVLPSAIDFAPISECIRHALSLYMFIIRGPTYYSHATMMNTLTLELKFQLQTLVLSNGIQDSLIIWLLSIGMVSSAGTGGNQWYIDQARITMAVLNLRSWSGVLIHLKSVLWLEIQQGELFHQMWETALA